MRNEKARRNFWTFRTRVNKKLKVGWWQLEIAAELQQFLKDMVEGKKPILIIQAPPQHGKSVQIIDFLAWAAGRHPHLKQIFASFSKRLGVRANLRLQRIMSSPAYIEIFPDFKLPTRKDKGYTLNMDLIEFLGQEGSFRNTTAGGSVTGESLDLGIIDDPIKGREAASSETIRNKTWEWFADDFFTRFSESAALLIIGTRWHVDDPIGRLIKSKPDNLRMLKYAAIAIEDEKHRKEGEVLFPELKSLEFILARKKLQGTANFESLYQQNPLDEGGIIFEEGWFLWYGEVTKYSRIVISWDTGFKESELNDPSVATVWGEVPEGYHQLEVVKKRMGYPELRKKAEALAMKWSSNKYLFTGNVQLLNLIEDKASGQSLIQDLKTSTKLNVVSINPESDKITRASTCSPQVEAGKVYLKTGAPWVEDYIEEMTTFPNGPHDDQVDSTSQFLNWASAGVGKITDLFFEE
jgi:predicted phage terminase large subunit-like protein